MIDINLLRCRANGQEVRMIFRGVKRVSIGFLVGSIHRRALIDGFCGRRVVERGWLMIIMDPSAIRVVVIFWYC
jgi:hypothetical protein